MHTEIWWGNLREGDHLEHVGEDERIILKWIFEKWDEVMEYIYLTQNRDSWRALVNAVLNLQVP